MNDTRDETRTGPSATVAVGAIPAPVCGYEVPDEEPVIAETNGPFETAFESIQPGTPVRHWLREAVGATGTRVDDVCSSLADGRAVDAELGGRPAKGKASGRGRYRFRTFDGAASGAGGYVLVTESPPGGTGDVETDRIASVISHDLRNPLDVANAHLQAARETGEEEHFDEVRQSHDRMEQIIQDVLTLARGKSALSISASVDIEAVAADAWASVETREASLAIEDDLSTIDADPDRLQRLFENLFRNSIDHARPGTPDADQPSDAGLQIRVGSTDGGFFVGDNGTGVPPEDRTRVFDPGYSRAETGGGTGLGLTIVEEIAEAHDWTVSLTAGSLGGARFAFRPHPREDRDGENGDMAPEGH